MQNRFIIENQFFDQIKPKLGLHLALALIEDNSML